MMVGANRVISPYVTSGRRMAAMAIQPEVVDFLEQFNQPLDDIGLELGKVEVMPQSELDQSSLAQIDLRRRSGAMVLAVYTSAGVVFNPDAHMQLQSGQRLMVLGSRQQLIKLKEMAAGTQS
jgi:voltage-gated potassium channel